MKKILISILEKLKIKPYAVSLYLAFNKKRFEKRKFWYLKSDKLNIKFNTNDKYSWKWFYGLHGTKAHEPLTTEIFTKYITKDSTVIDVGAHIGYFTCISGYLAKEVHSFEVDKKCIPLIEANINLNGFNNVHLNNLAISDQSGIVKIQDLEAPNPCITINHKTNNSFTNVNSISLDQYIEEKGITPNFIKIDIIYY